MREDVIDITLSSVQLIHEIKDWYVSNLPILGSVIRGLKKNSNRQFEAGKQMEELLWEDNLPQAARLQKVLTKDPFVKLSKEDKKFNLILITRLLTENFERK